METKRKLLYLDDEAENLPTLTRMLREHYDIQTCTTPDDALNILSREPYDVVVTDQRMPEMTGVEFLKRSIEKKLIKLGILLTAYSDLDALIDAVNHGVIFRYLPKPLQEFELVHALDQAFEKIALINENENLIKRLEQANTYLRSEINETYDFSILGDVGSGLSEVIKMIKKVSQTPSTVLIRGESGTGKELVARAIHEASPRKSHAFIRVNCAALSENLLESELFGHEKGAFTGALTRRIGKFEAAHRGTIFLDEIGDISPKLQMNLLRVLQEKEFERVGGNDVVKTDVRVIAATHQNLERKIKDQAFREDLYFRLNVFPILIPPLRERLGDLPDLCHRIIQKIAKRSGTDPLKLSQSSMQKLKDYDWPGNVRELENILERALILSTSQEIQPEDILLDLNLENTPSENNIQVTKEVLEQALLDSGGNKVEAARKLGIKRPTLYYHLKRFNL